MSNINLAEVIKNVKQPSFDDAMIKKLIEGLDLENTRYYKFIQLETSLGPKFSGTIDREAEQELWSKKEKGFNQSNAFRHMGNTGDIDYAITRLYINCAKKDLMNLSLLFLDKCNAQDIPVYFKYASNESVRSDQFIIYSNLKNLPDYIQFLEEIGEENPDLVKRCGKPPLLTGVIDEWIGIGDEPTENASFTELRANIIESTLKRILDKEKIDFDFDFENSSKKEKSHIEDIDYDFIREELRKAFQEKGIDINTFSFNSDNIGLYMADENTRQKYDSQIKSILCKNKERKKESVAEQIAFKELKILESMGVTLDGLENMISASSARYGLLIDLYQKVNISEELKKGHIIPKNANVSENLKFGFRDENGCHEMTDEQKQEISSKMLDNITTYYTNFFNNQQLTIDKSLSRYAELYDFPNGQNENIDIEKVDLNSKLRMLASGKTFFETIGIPSEKTELVCNKVQAFLQDLEQKREEQERPARGNKKREIDREFLYEFFRETGITDSEELRKIYQNTEGLQDISKEDLEIVLDSLTDSENIDPSQIGKLLANVGGGLEEINRSAQQITYDISKDSLTLKDDESRN